MVFQVEYQASNHATLLVSLENLAIYVPGVAKRIADIQQSVLLLLSEVRQMVYRLSSLLLFKDELDKLLYLCQS